MSWNRFNLSILIVVLYLVIAGIVIFISYLVSPPIGLDQYRDFWARTGVILTAAGVLATITVSLFTLNTQIKSAIDLAEQNGRITAELTKLKGRVDAQNEFLKQTLSAKSAAYEKMFVASARYYRVLQKLALGKYDEAKIDECEIAFIEAEGFAANLNDEDKRIVDDIRQDLFNITDEIDELGSKESALTQAQLVVEYKRIWDDNATTLGDNINNFRQRSIFRQTEITQIFPSDN